MEDVLSKLVQHGVNYAIRSGIAITTGYAINASSRLLKSVKGTEKDEIADLQAKLQSKINIISPPIDMIELIAARGNTTLDSALTLTKQLRMAIQELGVRLNQAATEEEKIRRRSASALSPDQMTLELKLIIADMKRLLVRIEDAVPLLMLAITTSGASLSTSLPPSVSPSRLLQASTFLSAGDSNYAALPSIPTQIGPSFTLTVYMLFAAHALRPQDQEGITETTWKEVIRKAKVKLMRVPLSDLEHKSASESNEKDTSRHYLTAREAQEFAYQITIIEDLNDDRFHEELGQPFEDVTNAGMHESIPIHQVSKIFYADTGKILKIGSDGEPNNPILLIKRDVNAEPPRRMMSEDGNDEVNESKLNEDVTEENGPDAQSSTATAVFSTGFPRDLDPEWIALEVFTEPADTESEDEADDDELDIASSPPVPPRRRSTDYLSQALSSLRLRGSPAAGSAATTPAETTDTPHTNLSSSQQHQAQPAGVESVKYFSSSSLPALRSSLSLLELLIRLTALQQFQQASHLTINDEFLNFFLSGSSSTGAGADSEYRRRLRRDARIRVGFDPFDESPSKPRGEDYIRNHQNNGYGFEDEDDDWQQWQDNGSRSRRGSSGLRSPSAYAASPSRSRDPQDYDSGHSPRTRSHMLRRDLGLHGRSPLGRSDSDSTLGTSPRTPALDELRK